MTVNIKFYTVHKPYTLQYTQAQFNVYTLHNIHCTICSVYCVVCIQFIHCVTHSDRHKSSNDKIDKHPIQPEVYSATYFALY